MLSCPCPALPTSRLKDKMSFKISSTTEIQGQGMVMPRSPNGNLHFSPCQQLQGADVWTYAGSEGVLEPPRSMERPGQQGRVSCSGPGCVTR